MFSISLLIFVVSQKVSFGQNQERKAVIGWNVLSLLYVSAHLCRAPPPCPPLWPLQTQPPSGGLCLYTPYVWTLVDTSMPWPLLPWIGNTYIYTHTHKSCIFFHLMDILGEDFSFFLEEFNKKISISMGLILIKLKRLSNYIVTLKSSTWIEKYYLI